MSRLQKLVEQAQQGKDIQDIFYGPFPTSIASECGPDEVFEIIEVMDRCCTDLEETESWDGDSMDDIYKSLYGYSRVLALILPRCVTEVAAGLKSSKAETRLYVAIALRDSPVAGAVGPLIDYLANDMPDHHREVGESALNACKAMQSSP